MVTAHKSGSLFFLMLKLCRVWPLGGLQAHLFLLFPCLSSGIGNFPREPWFPLAGEFLVTLDPVLLVLQEAHRPQVPVPPAAGEPVLTLLLLLI